MPADKTLLQIRVPAGAAADWRADARRHGLPLGAYVTLRMAGRLDPPPEKPADGAVQGPLRDRVLAAMGAEIERRSVGEMARRLGVPPRSVHASLGSMVAAKRLVRVGDIYRKV